MKKKRIVVTQDDIDNGIRGDYCECAVARAIRRAFRAPRQRKIVVRPEVAFVGNPEDDVMWVSTLPKNVDRFIRRWDANKPVTPFAVDLEFV